LENDKNPEALFMMAKLHEDGLSVDKNVSRAVSYLEKASELGYHKAMTKLAHYCYSGYQDDSFRL
jgi:TPR repeat protein